MALDPSDAVVEIRTRIDDVDAARRIAAQLVERRLVACAHVTAAGTSTYRWQGTVHVDAEHEVVASTIGRCVGAAVAAIVEAHPYELPSIVWHPVGATEEYAGWVASEVQA